jgi:hypothetical protein
MVPEKLRKTELKQRLFAKFSNSVLANHTSVVCSNNFFGGGGLSSKLMGLNKGARGARKVKKNRAKATFQIIYFGAKSRLTRGDLSEVAAPFVSHR